LAAPGQEAVGDAEQVFRNPPALSRPGVWWHWMGCNVSGEGITRDLEALKEAGFGSATIFGMADTCSPWACPITNSPTAGLIVNQRHTDFQSVGPLVSTATTKAYKRFLYRKRGFQVVSK
jgi:hypothetical protein